jgi:hypothetical protein
MAGNAANGTVVTVTASLGQLTVTLTGTAANEAGGTALIDPRLKVAGSGRSLWQGPVNPPDRAVAVIPLPIGPTKSPAMQSDEPLCVARFAGADQPAILLGLYTGGAHCCTVVRAMSLSGTGASSFVDRNLGNPTAALSAEGDNALVVTADDAFSYAFTDYAESGAPIQTLEVQHGDLVNTIRQHPRLVAADTQKWMDLFIRQPANPLGYLAAWAADECVAGQDAQVWATLGTYQEQGRLPPGPFSPGGSAFVEQLRQFLGEHGYCS